MYAIIELGGQQWKVSPGSQIAVNRLPYAEGSEFTIEQALLVSDGTQVQVGAPYLPASIRAKVEKHLQAPKVVVFKKKRRKGYKRKKGHRQAMTLVTIQSL